MSEGALNPTRPHPEWRILESAFGQAEFGSEISHEEIEGLTGLTRQFSPHQYYGMVQRWKRAMLEDHDREVETQRGAGYRIVQPNEHVRRSRRQMLQARRRIRQGVKVLVHTDHSRLTPAENAKHADALSHLGRLKSLLDTSTRKTQPSVLARKYDKLPKIGPKPEDSKESSEDG